MVTKLSNIINYFPFFHFLSFSLSVRLSVHMSVSLSLCLSVSLSLCLSVSLSLCLSVSLLLCLSVALSLCIYLSTPLPLCILLRAIPKKSIYLVSVKFIQWYPFIKTYFLYEMQTSKSYWGIEQIGAREKQRVTDLRRERIISGWELKWHGSKWSFWNQTPDYFRDVNQ